MIGTLTRLSVVIIAVGYISYFVGPLFHIGLHALADLCTSIHRGVSK